MCVFCVCVCVHACVCGRNELEVCTTLAYPHISSFRTIHKHMHTHILKPFEDSEPMGLKVDIAESSTGPVAILLAMPAEVSLPMVWPVKERVPLVHWPFYWPWAIRAVAIPDPVNRLVFIFYVFYSLLFIGAVAM